MAAGKIKILALLVVIAIQITPSRAEHPGKVVKPTGKIPGQGIFGRGGGGIISSVKNSIFGKETVEVQKTELGLEIKKEESDILQIEDKTHSLEKLKKTKAQQKEEEMLKLAAKEKKEAVAYAKKVFSNPEKYLEKSDPILIFSGLRSNCDHILDIVESFKKRSIYHWLRISSIQCVPYTTGIFTNFEKAAQEACKITDEIVKKMNLDMIDKITLLGFSQGGIIARYILQHCPVGEQVGGIITVGTPNMGVTGIPTFLDAENEEKKEEEMGFIEKAKRSLVKSAIEKFTNFAEEGDLYTEEKLDKMAPLAYYKSFTKKEEYLKTPPLIARLNNEVQHKHSARYIKRVSSLKWFLAIEFTDDHMVFPRESQSFGFWKNWNQADQKKGEVSSVLQQRNIVGLFEGEMNLLRKLKVIKSKGGHLQFDLYAHSVLERAMFVPESLQNKYSTYIRDLIKERYDTSPERTQMPIHVRREYHGDSDDDDDDEEDEYF